MIEMLQRDMAKRPELFFVNGPIPRPEDACLRMRRRVVPDDLKQLWCETGGGDMLESETILEPYGKVDLTDDIDSVNDFPWPRGMPANWLVFATGMGDLTVVKMSTGEYANIWHSSYEVTESLGSLAEGYAMIRNELASRYGLT
jgi:hypothetical protein